MLLNTEDAGIKVKRVNPESMAIDGSLIWTIFTKIHQHSHARGCPMDHERLFSKLCLCHLTGCTQTPYFMWSFGAAS